LYTNIRPIVRTDPLNTSFRRPTHQSFFDPLSLHVDGPLLSRPLFLSYALSHGIILCPLICRHRRLPSRINCCEYPPRCSISLIDQQEPTLEENETPTITTSPNTTTNDAFHKRPHLRPSLCLHHPHGRSPIPLGPQAPALHPRRGPSPLATHPSRLSKVDGPMQRRRHPRRRLWVRNLHQRLHSHL
jgi:hypothetical protein